MTEIHVMLSKGLLARISFRSPIIPTSCTHVTLEAERGEKGGGGGDFPDASVVSRARYVEVEERKEREGGGTAAQNRPHLHVLLTRQHILTSLLFSNYIVL
jgi:hypothetical protein